MCASSGPRFVPRSGPITVTGVSSTQVAVIAGSPSGQSCCVLIFGSGCHIGITPHGIGVPNVRGFHSLKNCGSTAKGRMH